MNLKKNRIKITLLFLISITLISCGKSGIFKNSDSKEDYLRKYDNLDLEDQKKAASQDLSDLDSLMGLAKGFSLYYSFSFSAGSMKPDSVKIEMEAVESFQISSNEDSAKAALAKITEFPELSQSLETPESKIDSDIPTEDKNGATVNSKITKIFSKGKETTIKKIGLQKADSAYVQVAYEYPSSMQRYKIPSSKKDQFTIEKSIIEIEKNEDSQFEFQFPQAMYQRLLGYQALDEDGILMNPNANSAFPVTSVRKSIALELEKTKTILEKAKLSKTQKDFLALLKNIPTEVFPHKNRLIDLDKAMDKMGKAEKNKKNNKDDGDDLEKIVEPVKKMMEDFQDILAPENQQVEMSFPNKVSTLYFYIGQQYKTLSAKVTAINFNEEKEYLSYFDSKKKKYGIVNGAGEIVLQPSLETPVSHKENNIFSDYTSSFLLNAKKGKLTKLDHQIFVQSVGKDRMIFEDSLKMQGVLDDNQKEIIPFIYKSIGASGDLYVGEKSLRGRTYFQILDKDGKILFERVNNVQIPDYVGGLIIETMDKKTALLNKEGKFAIPPQNEQLYFVGEGPLLKYELDNGHQGLRLGIMDAKGKKLSPPNFTTIRNSAENLMIARHLDSDFYEYIKPDGTTAFPGKFLDADDFLGGFAVVETEDEKLAVINKKGSIVLNIPVSAGNFRNQTLDGKNVIFEFENETFNSKNIINK